jgi:hypothetical protein
MRIATGCDHKLSLFLNAATINTGLKTAKSYFMAQELNTAESRLQFHAVGLHVEFVFAKMTM